MKIEQAVVFLIAVCLITLMITLGVVVADYQARITAMEAQAEISQIDVDLMGNRIEQFKVVFNKCERFQASELEGLIVLVEKGGKFTYFPELKTITGPLTD